MIAVLCHVPGGECQEPPGQKQAKTLAAGRTASAQDKSRKNANNQHSKGGFYLGQSAEQRKSRFPAVYKWSRRHSQVQ